MPVSRLIRWTFIFTWEVDLCRVYGLQTKMRKWQETLDSGVTRDLERKIGISRFSGSSSVDIRKFYKHVVIQNRTVISIKDVCMSNDVFFL